MANYHCGAQARAARFYVDPEPAEYCEAEVAQEGDLCPLHEEPDEPDYYKTDWDE